MVGLRLRVFAGSRKLRRFLGDRLREPGLGSRPPHTHVSRWHVTCKMHDVHVLRGHMSADVGALTSRETASSESDLSLQLRTVQLYKQGRGRGRAPAGRLCESFRFAGLRFEPIGRVIEIHILQSEITTEALSTLCSPARTTGTSRASSAHSAVPVALDLSLQRTRGRRTPHIRQPFPPRPPVVMHRPRLISRSP